MCIGGERKSGSLNAFVSRSMVKHQKWSQALTPR